MGVGRRREGNQGTGKHVASSGDVVAGLIPIIRKPEQGSVRSYESAREQEEQNCCLRRAELCVMPQIQCTGPAACTRGSSLISPKVLS